MTTRLRPRSAQQTAIRRKRRPIRLLRFLALLAIAPALLLGSPAGAGPPSKALHKTPVKPATAVKATGPSTFTDTDFSMGSPTAPVTVVEYLSNVCSHCAAFDKTVWPAIKAKYVDTGKVRWVIREFLTSPENLAAAGFVLARCTGKTEYFPTIEALFRAQDEMAKTNQIKAIYLRIAAEHGLSEAKFNACIDDKAAYDALGARMKKAVEVDKVEFTPTLIINGKRPFEGAPSIGELSAAIEAAGGG